MIDTLPGVRHDLTESDGLPNPGEYGKVDGYWYGCPPVPPVNEFALMANLSKHEVTEHPDGTISVSPSILIKSWDREPWHGYLVAGQWREV